MARRTLVGLAVALTVVAAAWWVGMRESVVSAQGTRANCRALPSTAELQGWLVEAAETGTYGEVGGLFGGTRMWAAVVNRDGEICGYITTTQDPTQVWPGSQAIAKAKAYTANAFSLDDFALSTARLYTFTQPGHSLWSLGQSNLFNSHLLVAPGGSGDRNAIAGGLIFFGGGVPLYAGGKIVGGLGISGDTSCADHEIAKRVRDLAEMNPAGGPTADDIDYEAGWFTHPLCINTFKNGMSLGDETEASPY